METINDLLSQNEGKESKGIEKSNDVQGLFYELLACLGGGDHSSLPRGFKQKPMSGFCDILDAFNETIRIREAGSGTVCDVTSAESTITSNSDLVEFSGSGATLESTESLPDDFQRSLINSDKLFSSSDSGSNTTTRESTPEDINTQLSVQDFLETENCKYDNVDYKDAPNVIETDFNGNITTCSVEKLIKQVDSENASNKDSLPQPCIQFPTTYQPEFVDEVGPPLSLLQPSASLITTNEPLPQRTTTEYTREFYNYSDEIREIERILRENIIPPPRDRFLGSPYATGSQTSPILIGSGVVQQFSDGLMSPNSALDMMYDAAESVGNPHSAHLSTYQSCTSFSSYQNQTHLNQYMSLSPDSIERTNSSVFMDCLNLENTGNNEAHFAKALESVNPSFVCVGVEGITDIHEPAEALATVEDDVPICESTCVLVEKPEEIEKENMPDSMCPSIELNLDEQEFKDAPEFRESESSDSNLMNKKHKKRAHVVSSEDEHLWSSACPSETDELN